MRKLKTLFALLVLSFFTIGNVWATAITVSHNQTTTCNMSGANQADLFSAGGTALNTSVWSFVGAKNDASNNVGLNKDGTTRFYCSNSNSSSNTNGSSLTVTLTGGTIDSIRLNHKSGTLKVLVGGNEVTASNGKYTISGTSFVLQHVAAKGTAQVQLNSITINYTLSGGGTPATAIELNKTSTTLEQYREETLTATLTPNDATSSIEWTSSVPAVATVTNGLIKALTTGTTVITATAEENVQATCTVTVTAPTILTCALAAEYAQSVSGNNIKYAGGQYVVEGYAISKSDNNYIWLADDANAAQGTFEIYLPTNKSEIASVVIGSKIRGIGYITKFGSTSELAAGCVFEVIPMPSLSADPNEITNVAYTGVDDQTIALTYENIENYLAEVTIHPNADGTGTLSPAWLSASVSDADNYATLTYSVEANEAEARTAYMKVYAIGTGDKEATLIIPVSQVAAPCAKKVNIVKGTPETDGSFALDKDGQQESCEGLVVTVSNITAPSGKQFNAITQSGVESGVTIDQEAKTVTYASNTTGTSTINVTFVDIPKYTVTLMDDTEHPLVEASAGAGVTLPSRTGCAEYTFTGWTASWESAQTEWTTTAPTIIPAGAYAPTANVNLYPVYTKSEIGGTKSYNVTTTLAVGKTYVFGAVKATASASLANNTTFGAVAFTNTYNTTSPNWGARVDLTPNASGVLTGSDTTSLISACKWVLESITNGNYAFKNGSNYIYLGKLVGNTTNGAQCGVYTSANMYLENVNSTCKDAFLCHPSSTTDSVMLYNTGSNGYRMYASRSYTASMTPYVRFYEFDPGTTISYISVPDCSQKPTITTQPVGATYGVGDAVTALSIAATASEGTLHYAWKSNNQNSTTEGTITAVGTDAATYTPSSTSAGKTYYFCIVTDDHGSVTSNVVEVSVIAPVDPEITFNNGSVYVGSTLDLSTLFESNSEGDVTYSITAGGSYANLVGSVLTATAAGSVTVQANQAAVIGFNAATKSCTITVNTPVKYVKVTSAPLDWSGEYLLAFDTIVSTVATAFVWTGVDATNCYSAVAISDGKITKPSSAVTLTIEALTGDDAGKYSILINGGDNDDMYVGAFTSSQANFVFAQNAVAATISYATNCTQIYIGAKYIRFNAASNQLRFRGYAEDGQKAVQLYKKDDGGTTGFDNIESDVKAVKVLRDGQIYILRGEKVYTIQGQLVK